CTASSTRTSPASSGHPASGPRGASPGRRSPSHRPGRCARAWRTSSRPRPAAWTATRPVGRSP
ncbi:MAG: hypothetical protein AVDCRST_MAG13-283, partial [uncultured Solirubrobacteraceae bacterium]